MLKHMDYSAEQGYPESRFSSAVDEDLNCAICLNILKEPLQCEMNEHHFCAACITRHLHSTPRCPSCLEDLSLETLKKPARYLTKHLSSLLIKCDHESRGCPEFVMLEYLPRHLQHCGYAPVPCQNQGCCEVVNKQDQVLHETEICRRRRSDCHDCATTKKGIRELKDAFEEFKVKKEISEEASRKEIGDLKVAIGDLKVAIGDLKVARFEELDVKKDINNEVKVSLEELKNEVFQMRDLKTLVNKEPCKVPASENVIVVIGGCNGADRLTSTEMYVWSEKKWLPLPDTTEPRSGSSAVVYENKIIVAGGVIDMKISTDTIEAICVDRKPAQWFDHPGMLPHSSCYQNCIVYQDRLIVIGGAKTSCDELCDSIYEVSLRSPYTYKFLSTMPVPRAYHRAELIGDKIVIIGGMSGDDCIYFELSVLLFDIATGEYHEICELRSGICDMATVTWGDNVVVIGGRNSNGETLNTIKMFNINTAETYMLPPMKYKRSFCTAVVINNCIVVMGGFGDNRDFLDVVECFDFSTYTWTELPPMNEARSSSTSVVVPVNLSLML